LLFILEDNLEIDSAIKFNIIKYIILNSNNIAILYFCLIRIAQQIFYYFFCILNIANIVLNILQTFVFYFLIK